MMLLVFAIQLLARLADCQGSLVMIGGNLREDNTQIWERMVNLSAVQGEARIGVITAANSDPAYWAEYYVQLFMLHGAEAVWVPVTLEDPQSAYSQENVRIIKSCSSVFHLGQLVLKNKSKLCKYLYFDKKKTFEKHLENFDSIVFGRIKSSWL